jgi:hypothetical protein
VTNELYLYVSYFAAGAGGVGLAALTAIMLAGPNRRATGWAALPQLGKFLRRALPSWLILAVLLGFISVTYFDCSHNTYAEIAADRGHLVDKTQEQVHRMVLLLAVALLSYSCVLALFLIAGARTTMTCEQNGA